MQTKEEQELVIAAMTRVDMESLINAVAQSLQKILGDRLDLKDGLVYEQVPPERQITIPLDDIKAKAYTEPHR